MSPAEAIAFRIPHHITRGWIVGAVQEGEILDIRRCWSSLGSGMTRASMGSEYPEAEIVTVTVPEVLTYCADLSSEVFA